MLYAFDADDFSSMFTVNFGEPMDSDDVRDGAGYADFPSCDGEDEAGTIGIVGTPVIDLGEGALYLVANTVQQQDDKKLYFHTIHKVSLQTGAELVPARVIEGNFQGIVFNSRYHLQRTALLLAGGRIYVAFASHNDERPYYGWLFSYDTNLNLVQFRNYSPKRSGTGIWQSGAGPASDGQSVYLTTGNNAEDEAGPEDYSDSILRINPETIEVDAKASFFSESNDWDDNADLDLGSSRVIALPDSRYLISGSKLGDAFLIDRSTMAVTYRFTVSARQSIGFDWTGIYNGLAYWNKTLFAWPGGGAASYDPVYPVDHLKAYTIGDTAQLVAYGQTDGLGLGYQGANLVISASGTDPATGIVWASTPANNSGWIRPGHLHAYAAGDLSTSVFQELWNDVSDDPAASYNFAKFTQPTIANGRVYLPTASSKVIVYGLLSSNPTRPVDEQGAGR